MYVKSLKDFILICGPMHHCTRDQKWIISKLTYKGDDIPI